MFVCFFVHIMRALANQSFIYLPATWVSGLMIYFITIATAFLGYVLPWGQMSFWGATVITNLLDPIPYFVTWLVGGYYVDDPTLKRFFVLHFVLPFVSMVIVVLHIFYLHLQGSSHPLGYDSSVMVPFYPHMLSVDVKGFNNICVLLFIQSYFGIIELSHPDNSCPVNRFVTPLQIVPEWYFLSLYAILKVIPSKTGGLLILVATQLILLLLSEQRKESSILFLRQSFGARDHCHMLTVYQYCYIALLIIGAQLPLEVFILYGRLFVVLFILSNIGFVTYRKV